MEKVSIVIPVYNCEYTDQAIESALNQTYPHIEVIVVNDGSTHYTEKIYSYKGKIKLIEQANGGTASALNTGIKNATGDLIAWLSADDKFYPTKTAEQLEFMKAHNADISYGGFVLINNAGKVTTESMLGGKFPDKLSFLKALKNHCPVNGCTVMARKEVFDYCGLFNETIPYAHDYDMWLRIVQHYDFHFFNKPVVEYRIHDKMGTVQYKPALLLEAKQLRNKYRASLNQLIRQEILKIRDSPFSQ